MVMKTPVANDSDGVMFSCVGVDCRWLVHADNLFSEGLHVMGWTECTKLILDLRRFVWCYMAIQGVSVVCFSLWEDGAPSYCGGRNNRELVETLDFSWFEASCN